MRHQDKLKYGMKAMHFALRNRKLVAGAAMAIGALAGRTLYDFAKNIRR